MLLIDEVVSEGKAGASLSDRYGMLLHPRHSDSAHGNRLTSISAACAARNSAAREETAGSTTAKRRAAFPVQAAPIFSWL